MNRMFAPLAVALSLGTTATVAASKPAAAPQANVAVSRGWARETAPGQANGGGFMVIANKGKHEDRLVSGKSPAAKEIQLHTMSMDGGVMRMRQLENGIAVPAGGSVALKPGSLHLMFIGLRQPLKRGAVVPVTLHFARAGDITVRLAVQPVGAMGPGGMHDGH
jgi:copper(I)-binding protein